MDMKIGQMVRFFRAVPAGSEVIRKGERARIAHVLAELGEPKVTVVLLDRQPAQSVTVLRHEVTLNSLNVEEAG